MRPEPVCYRPPIGALSAADQQDRMAALLAAEYVGPDWGLPDQPADTAQSPFNRCHQDLGRASDAVILAALGLALGRYGGVARPVLALTTADGGPVPALCSLSVLDSVSVAELLDAATDQLSRPWPSYDGELARALKDTEGGGQLVADVRLGTGSAAPGRLPLTVTVRAAADGSSQASYQFRREVIGSQMGAQFARSVRQIVGQLRSCSPEAPLSQIELLDPLEQEQLLRLGESGRRTPGERRRLDELVAARAAEHPDAVAVTDGGAGLSYRRLDAQANRLARALRAAGVLTGDRVGVCLPRTAELVVILLGILRAGAAYVPMEPDNPADRLEYLVDNARPAVVISDRPEFPAAHASLVHPAELARVAEFQSAAPLPVQGRAEDAAYVIYTSGSTGRPKGVAVSHRNVTALIEGATEDFQFGPADVWALFHSVAFDMSVWEIWGSLSTGGRLVVIDKLTSRSPRELHALLVAEQVTVLNQTPSAFAQLLDADSSETGRLALRLVTFGGEPLDTRMLVPWFDRHPEHECTMVNLYGITETTVHSTWTTLSRAAASAATREVGTALPGESLSVRDPGGRLLPAGVIGEIYVGGVGVALGYLNRPDLTAERFLPDPLTGQRVYRSGDRGRLLPTGRLEHLGRLDGQVKLRGYRIELDEVRAALLAAPGVVAAAVVVAGDPADPGSTRLDAYVVAAPAGIDPAGISKHLSTILPDYMLPATITALAALPLTVNGKLDRARLPRPAAATAEADLEPDGAGGDDSYAALSRTWSKLTGLPAGPDDNLFDMGGNSIIIGRLVKQLENQGLPRLPLRQIYLAPTLRRVAELLESLR